MARMSPAARSVFAVVDGFLLFLALQGAFYALAFLGLSQSFDKPTRVYLLCNFGWAMLSALLAGWLAGQVARRKPVLHGLILAIPFFALSLWNFNKGVGGRHTLFVLAYNVLVPAGFIAGSALAGRRRPNV